ncbi:MAG: isocitrate lyase/PEP mutase family protein [Actinomycetes bacterium]
MSVAVDLGADVLAVSREVLEVLERRSVGEADFGGPRGETDGGQCHPGIVSSVSRQQEKGAAFRALHEGEPFVLPNPWDVGSARVLAALGFPALATTSSGFAFTLGRLDGQVTLDEVVQHAAALDAATDLPLTVDLENGYGADPGSAALAVRRAAGAGAVGASIEDYDPEGSLYSLAYAKERIAAAVESAHGLGFPFTVTARAENHIRGNPDLEDTISRLQAFEEAGADVLYAPGLRDVHEISAVCESVTRPVNVLALPGLTMAEIAGAGARRVSVGGSLTWVAARALADAAVVVRDTGDLSPLTARVPLEDWFT